MVTLLFLLPPMASPRVQSNGYTLRAEDLTVKVALLPTGKVVQITLKNESGMALALLRDRGLFRFEALDANGVNLSNEIAVYRKYQFPMPGRADWTVLRNNDVLTFHVGLMMKPGASASKIEKLNLSYKFSDRSSIYVLIDRLDGGPGGSTRRTMSEEFEDAGAVVIRALTGKWTRGTPRNRSGRCTVPTALRIDDEE